MIQYPKQEHVTLPSVEGWGTSLNILKDPPKAVWTRQINKVGSTSQLTMELDGASDRACEYIKVYPRGVNPMVGVSYTNYGTNGGQYNFVSSSGNTSSSTRFSRKKSAIQARLPYPALKDGAFRPPVFRQEDLLPLSRLPRTNTEAWTKPGFPNYVRDLACAQAPDASNKMRQIVTDRMQTDVKPTRIVDIRRPAESREDYRQVNKKKAYISAVAIPAGADRTHHRNSAVSGRIQDPAHYTVPGVRGAPRLVETFVQEINPSRYLSEVSYEDVRAGGSLPTMGGGAPSADRQRKYLQEVLYKEVRAGKQLAGGDVAVDRQTVRVLEEIPHVSVGPRRVLRVVQPPVPTTGASYGIQDVEYSDVRSSCRATRAATAQPQSGKNETKTLATYPVGSRASIPGARQTEFHPRDLERVLPRYSTGARPTATSTAVRQSDTVILQELQPNRPATSATATSGTNVGGDFYAVTARKKDIKAKLSVGASFAGKATVPVVSRERIGVADRDGRKQRAISSARNAAAGRT